jgi:hypothetical protein
MNDFLRNYITEMMNLKDLGKSGCGLIEVLSQYMHAETEKSHKILNQDSNQARTEYKCIVCGP